MATMTIELPTQASQTDFNLRRWEELLTDRELAKIEGRIETDRFGRIVMSPLEAARHGGYQAEIGCRLRTLMKRGRGTTECPVSTADGVKGTDVSWASPECLGELGNRSVYPKCPEICVEVLSPSNTRAEIEEKARLYFDAGGQEVWQGKNGKMTFWGPGLKEMAKSKLCPAFPKQVRLQ